MKIKPTDILGNIKLYNADNMEVMKTFKDKQFSLAIIDPPYGIGMAMGHKGSEKRGDKNKYKSFSGDDNSIPGAHYFTELFRVSQNQIIWGANYMTDYLTPTPCFIVWDKVQPKEFSMAMCELAWTSFKTPAKIYKLRVVGADPDGRIHPTQKPAQLYKWLLQNYAKEGDTILDTHFGSLSIGIACHDMKFDLTAIELDEDYYGMAKQRLINHQRQLTLF